MGRKVKASWNTSALLQKAKNRVGICKLLNSWGFSNRESFPTIYIFSCLPSFRIIKSFSHLCQDDTEPLGSGVVKYRGHTDLPWNFEIAGKVWVLNDNYCVEVQHYWQHNILEATVIQNSRCLLLWNILVPRYYCITMVPWPTAPLPIKQLLYIFCIYAWTTVEYIRALTLPAQSLQDSAFSYPASKQKQTQRRW